MLKSEAVYHVDVFMQYIAPLEDDRMLLPHVCPHLLMADAQADLGLAQVPNIVGIIWCCSNISYSKTKQRRFINMVLQICYACLFNIMLTNTSILTGNLVYATVKMKTSFINILTFLSVDL